MDNAAIRGGQRFPYFSSFEGIVRSIGDFNVSGMEPGCNKLVTLENNDGSVVNFLVTPNTYFVNWDRVTIGMRVSGFYETNAPAILIYPPQFRAVVISAVGDKWNVKVDWFDNNLVSLDGTLQLLISNRTQVVLENELMFSGSITRRPLVVLYGATTRSIPAQTTPDKIVVLCK